MLCFNSQMETSSVPPSLLEGAFTTGPDDRFGDMDCKCLISEELLYVADVKVDPYSPPILKDEKVTNWASLAERK